jgi:hypothetical protein
LGKFGTTACTDTSRKHFVGVCNLCADHHDGQPRHDCAHNFLAFFLQRPYAYRQATGCIRMPRGPKGEKRHADVNRNAVLIAKIATGEAADDVPTPESEGKNAAAVALGRMGGKARAVSISARRRKQIARQAAEKRWKSANRE